MKKECCFAVIILNYNVIADAIHAAESVINTTHKNNYVICIADNGSIKDRDMLDSISLPHTVVFKFNDNSGYAKGNNQAIRLLGKEYNFKYTVIMNPDVVIEEDGIIDRMIDMIEQEPNDIVGIQPLIHHLPQSWEVHHQRIVRRCRGFWDECLMQSMFLKHLFRKRIGYLHYSEKIPYKAPFYYEVPSGCFFMIKTNVFSNVGYFDERTFLYQEEFILAYKIKQLNKKFVLMTDGVVEHYHGKSTGNRNKGISETGHKALVDSVSLYLKEYVKSPAVAVWLLALMMKVEYKLKKVFRYYK